MGRLCLILDETAARLWHVRHREPKPKPGPDPKAHHPLVVEAVVKVLASKLQSEEIIGEIVVVGQRLRHVDREEAS